MDKVIRKEDFIFIYKLARTVFPSNIPEGLDPSFYTTGNYKIDKQYSDTITEIGKRYKVYDESRDI